MELAQDLAADSITLTIRDGLLIRGSELRIGEERIEVVMLLSDQSAKVSRGVGGTEILPNT